MIETLEFTIDKFTFKVATDRNYSPEGMWIKMEENHARIGISDYLQRRSGDVAFVEIKPVGTMITQGAEIVVIETIKVNISLSAPILGKVIETNPTMDSSPEVINQDPYGDGWLAILDIGNKELNQGNLLSPQAYFDKIRLEAEQEARQ